MTHGVVPEGFNRKPLSTILSEIEQDNVDTFGPEVIQTAQSPLGQLNGVFADLVAQLWEHAEAVYASHDVDQAEGTRLDVLAKLRLLQRVESETDAAFRKAITNVDRARVDVQDITRAVSAITGVTYARTYVNDTASTDANGVPANSVAVVALGGDDTAIGEAIRRYIVPGVSSYGDTRVDVEVEGVCRSLYFTRPTVVPLEMALVAATRFDANGCPPPAPAAIEAGIAAALAGDQRLQNGEDVDLYAIQAIVADLYGRTVQITSGTIGEVGATALGAFPFVIGFDEIASFALSDIDVTIS